MANEENLEQQAVRIAQELQFRTASTMDTVIFLRLHAQRAMETSYAYDMLLEHIGGPETIMAIADMLELQHIIISTYKARHHPVEFPGFDRGVI